MIEEHHSIPKILPKYISKNPPKPRFNEVVSKNDQIKIVDRRKNIVYLFKRIFIKLSIDLKSLKTFATSIHITYVNI